MKPLRNKSLLAPKEQVHRSYIWVWLGSLAIGLGFWLVDSLIHFTTYRDHLRRMLLSPPETYLESLILNISTHTLFVRLSFLTGSLLVGVLVYTHLERRARTEKQLQLEQTFSSEIIRRSPVIIHVVDARGSTILLNPTGQRILGYEDKKLPSHAGWKTLRSSLDSESLQDWITRVLNQELQTEQFPITTRAGEERICEWNHVLEYDDDGVVSGWISIGRDITEQVEASREINRLLKQQIAINQLALDLGETLDLKSIYSRLHNHLKHLTDCWTLLVSSLDPDTDLIHAEYMIFEGEEHDPGTLPPIPLNRDGTGRQSRVFLTGEPLNIPDYTASSSSSKVEYTYSNEGYVQDGPPPEESGERITRSAIYVPMKTAGQTLGVMQLQSDQYNAYSREDLELLTAAANVAAVAVQNARLYAALEHELTERKLVEQEVRVLNEELESRVRERTRRLEELNRELEDFAYVVSHDLKAPLRAVTQLTGWIRDDYHEVFDEQGRELLDLLISRTNRMHNLIQGILDFSRIDRIPERQMEVDLNQVVENVLDNLDPPDSIRISIDSTLPTILAVETHMIQVFQNLISNSIKFMDKDNARISVSARRDKNSWALCVQDNGPGIEPKYHERVFKIFQTLQPRDKMENTGVGLAIVKKIVENNGGKIWVESEKGKGCSFHFTYPDKEPDHAG